MIALLLVRSWWRALTRPGGQAVAAAGRITCADDDSARTGCSLLAQTDLPPAGQPPRSAGDRGTIPGTIRAPTACGRSGRCGSPGWNGSASGSMRFSAGSASFLSGSIRSTRRSPVAGNSIGTILLLAAVVAFFVGLAMLWIHRGRGRGAVRRPRARLGLSARMADLPEGFGRGTPIPGPRQSAAGGGRPGRGRRLFVRPSVARARSARLDPAGARPDRPALRAVAPRSRA